MTFMAFKKYILAVILKKLNITGYDILISSHPAKKTFELFIKSRQLCVLNTVFKSSGSLSIINNLALGHCLIYSQAS